MLSAPPFLALLLAAGPGPLTFQAALELADQQNPDVVGERLQSAVVAADVETAGALPNPTVGVSYGPDDPILFGTLEQRLPFFGQRSNAVAAARADQRAAAAHLAWTRARLRAEVRRAYFALAASQAQAEVQDRLASLAQKLSEASRKRYEVGTAAELDAEQAELTFERARQDAEDARAQLRENRTQLALLLGIADPDTLAAADPLVAPQHAPVPADSLENHPELAFNRLEVDAAESRASRERALVIPQPVVSLELQRLSGSPPVPGLRVGVVFDLPVLSWNRGPVHRAEAEATQLRALQQSTLARLTATRSAALARFSAARARAKLYIERLIPQARRVQELAQLSYSVGKAPLATVLQAQADLANDEVQGISSTLDLHRAIADLEELTP
ncbi:MAG: TolC family protein [Myxococcaceae bacterium]